MKVLLTGASGFVGSHVLDCLRARGLAVSVLLRDSSSRRFLEEHLRDIEICPGSVADLASLKVAVRGVTHVIHCAGLTKALKHSEFYEVNQTGTRNVVQAINANPGTVRRLVHISSLAAARPALPEQPAVEDDPPAPVSEYGKSKLAGEMEVRNDCQTEYVILRPPAVYGPRDAEFLRLFGAIKGHLLPKPRHQPLSLVYVKDLARVIVSCVDTPAAGNRTYFVASSETVTAYSLAQAIAGRMKVWTLPLPLPTFAMWPLCLAQEIGSYLTGKPAMLNLQKFAELRAPGWICSPARLERELGLRCSTPLQGGINETLDWYVRNGWL